MAFNEPVVFSAGQRLTETTLNQQLTDQTKAISDPWTIFNPTWTASVISPTIGNGTITGAYLVTQSMVLYRFAITIGSTTNVGSGVYTVTLPVDAIANQFEVLGAACYHDDSALGAPQAGVIRCGTAPNLANLVFSGARWSNTTPVAPATNDIISCSISYQAA